jgi:hypothetical protein
MWRGVDMSEDKSIDELINLAVSCGAGLYRNTCNAEVLTSFTQHELRVFYKAAQAAMRPEIAGYISERDNAIRATAIARKEIEQLQAKVAEAKREALEEAADRLERIAGEEGFYSNHVQTHDDDVKELRRMAADLRKRH